MVKFLHLAMTMQETLDREARSPGNQNHFRVEFASGRSAVGTHRSPKKSPRVEPAGDEISFGSSDRVQPWPVKAAA